MVLDDCISAVLENGIVGLFASKGNIEFLLLLLQGGLELWTIHVVSNRVLGAWILWLVDQRKLCKPSIC